MVNAEEYQKRGYNRLVSLLEESIDIIDKIEAFIGRIDPMRGPEPGLIFQIYQNLVVLRERLVEARMTAYEKCSCRDN